MEYGNIKIKVRKAFMDRMKYTVSYTRWISVSFFQKVTGKFFTNIDESR